MVLTQLEQEVLKLPEKERAILAEHLLSSLGEETMGLNEERWIEEAERRYQEYRAGRMTAKPADEVFEDAYRKLE
jgi:putative addiction module component (TIGR02574 family)